MKAHLGIRESRVNAIRFSQRFTEAKERGNSARRNRRTDPAVNEQPSGSTYGM